jgi:hypothetical protein
MMDIAVVSSSNRLYRDFIGYTVQVNSINFIHVYSVEDIRGRSLFDEYILLYDYRKIEHYDQLIYELKSRIKKK